MSTGRRKTGQPAEGEAQRLEPIVFEDESEPDPVEVARNPLKHVVFEDESQPDPAYLQQSGSLDPNRFVAAAREEARARQQKPRFPRPDAFAPLGEIERTAQMLIRSLEAVRDENLPIDHYEIQMVVTELRYTAQKCIRLAWEYGLYGVDQRVISQAELAEFLGASTATVSRRIKSGMTVDELNKLERLDSRNE